MEFLSLGKIIDSFGLDGTLKVYSTTNMGKKRYKAGNTVYLFDEENKEYIEYKVLNYRHNGNLDFVKLENINSKEDAFSKKGQFIFVEKNRSDLEPDTYFYSDLRGCEIRDNTGKKLGIVKEVEEFPAQITLRATNNGKDFFIPFIPEFIINVNVDEKYIVIKVIEGLLWE